MGCWAGGQRSPNNNDSEYDRPNYGTSDNRNSDGMTMVESDDARRCTFTSADVDTFTQTTTANFAVDAIIIRILAATSAIVTSSAIGSTMIFVTNAAHQPSSSTSLANKKAMSNTILNITATKAIVTVLNIAIVVSTATSPLRF